MLIRLLASAAALSVDTVRVLEVQTLENLCNFIILAIFAYLSE